MEYDKLIIDLQAGDQIEGFYVLRNPQNKLTGAGKPFLSAGLSDHSGVIEAKCWDYAGPIGAADEGKVIKIRGIVNMKAMRILLAQEECDREFHEEDATAWLTFSFRKDTKQVACQYSTKLGV